MPAARTAPDAVLCDSGLDSSPHPAQDVPVARSNGDGAGSHRRTEALRLGAGRSAAATCAAQRVRAGQWSRRMKIHEYQAKAILAQHGVPVPTGEMVSDAPAAKAAAERLGG